MAFLERLVGTGAGTDTVAQEPTANTTPPPEDDFWFEGLAGPTAAGYRVAVADALRVPAVRRAVAVLAGAVASLPLHIYRRTEDGRAIAREHPLYDVVHTAPGDDQDAHQFWQSMTASVICYNVAYAEIIPGRRGAVDQLRWLPTTDVQPIRLANGRRAYRHTDPETGRTRRLMPGEVFILRGLDLFGHGRDRSVIDDGRDTIANALALTDYIGKNWRNGTRLSGVLQHPETLSDEAADRLRRSWHKQYAGNANAGRTAVLEEGMTFHQLSQTNANAQLYEQWSHLVLEIARLFGVPSILLDASTKTSTYASAEQFFISFVVHSLNPWLTAIQRAVNTQLVLAPDTYYAEFNVQGLMRGDHKARAEFYSSGINAGWLTPNEARELENLNRRNGGDVLWRPSNVEPADSDPDEQGES